MVLRGANAPNVDDSRAEHSPPNRPIVQSGGGGRRWHNQGAAWYRGPVSHSTIIVAAAVLRHEGRVLLTRRRKDQHLAGMWEFPGGKLEPGEAPEETVARECLEECGIHVQVLDILEVTFHAYDERDVLLLFYDCRLVSGEVQHIEVADHVWCTPDELDDYPLPPADKPVVTKVKALAPV